MRAWCCIANDSCIRVGGRIVGRMSLITIVEDDQHVRASLEDLLEAAGFSTRSYASADALLDGPSWSDVDCFLFDVRMKGLGGLQLQQHLRDVGSRVPIVFLTAHSDDETRARAMLDGAYAFLAKPFDEDMLVATLEAAVAEKAAGV
jgi:FixJ family two-component response regulator